MNAGMKLIKYLLFAFNLIFVVWGSSKARTSVLGSKWDLFGLILLQVVFAFALIGVGAGVEILYRNLAHITGSAITSAPILLICVGVFILIIAFFGCCGAYKESYGMMCVFSGFMAFIFILEIAAAITAYSFRDKADDYLANSFLLSIKDYQSNIEKAYDIVQTKFECCGSDGPDDWRNSSTFQQHGRDITDNKNKDFVFVPDGCCEKVVKDCGLHHNETMPIYQKGCASKVAEAFKERIAVVGGITVAIVFIQIIGFGFACVLMRAIKAQYETV